MSDWMDWIGLDLSQTTTTPRAPLYRAVLIKKCCYHTTAVVLQCFRGTQTEGDSISCIIRGSIVIMGLYGKTIPKVRQYSMRITANAWMPAGNMLEIGLEKYGLRLCRKYS